MRTVSFFAPVVLCVVICLGALVGVVMPKATSYAEGLFFAFLPGCFLLMAGLMVGLSREVSRLRRRLAKLEGRVVSASPGGSHEGTHPGGESLSASADSND